ncbi:hypothetical protein [Paraburkholderia phosphatilytica]|uniref:hypothetical protein n=1 Tax=Paraburkholderia phosphatilytica TaxID=2282883 RepID=UPI001F0C5C84|nr:hypothetical protein [Paraburkholderia phosphatilytica]
MKTKILTWWPVAIVLVLGIAAWVRSADDLSSRAQPMPLAANALTAELARTVSYGFVSDASEAAVKPMPSSGSMSAPAAAL